MRNIIQASKLMLQLMGHPVPAVISASRKTVMRKASRPHYFSTCIVVLGVIAQDNRILLDRAQESFCKGIRVPDIKLKPLAKLAGDFYIGKENVNGKESYGYSRKPDRD
jgi:hypothetical protein